MYYNERSILIKKRTLDRTWLTALDRELAHAYAAGGRGFIDFGLLQSRVGASDAQLRPVLRTLDKQGVCIRYNQVKCKCGELYDPAEGRRAACTVGANLATPTGLNCIRTIRQPTQPAYDPVSPPASPTIFLSYRHSDCSTLAADIYYSLGAEGHSIFLDSGHIPVGAPPESVYLSAASRASSFIFLVSVSYFDSDYCKMEIAHAARKGSRMIRVNVPPTPSAPPGMSWIDTPNWNPQNGAPTGLTVNLEASLLSAVRTPATAPSADLKRYGCGYIMEQLSQTDLLKLWNRLGYMDRIKPDDRMDENIRRILQETRIALLPKLCTELGP